jgi:hypothetical protein
MTLVDGSGNLFIADTSNRIRWVDALTGVITTVAGNGVAGFSGDGGPAFAAQLNFNPGFSFFIDGSGNLLIADTGNNRIRRVDAVTGIITTIAGNGTFGFGGDGGSAMNASIMFPGIFQQPTRYQGSTQSGMSQLGMLLPVLPLTWDFVPEGRSVHL